MVVGKWPGTQEIQEGRNLIGASGALFGEVLESLGVSWEEASTWYITNLIKHAQVDPSIDQVPASWIKNWRLVLYQEIAIVRPKLILCLGGDAAAAVLGYKIAVKDALTRPFSLEVAESNSAPGYAAVVAVSMHPAAVLRTPEQMPFLADGLRSFLCKKSGAPAPVKAKRDWHVLWYEEDLSRVVDEILARCGEAPIFVFDSEWHGENPFAENAYLRTIQFTDRAGSGYCVVLRGQGGELAFAPDQAAVVRQLKRLVTPRPGYFPRIAGHHLRADLPWIYHHLDRELGQLLIDGYLPAETPELCRIDGGHDTMLIAHSIRETGFLEGFKLEYVCQALLGVERWNIELEAWKKSYCAARKIKAKDLEGYGEVPDSILFSYAIGDVDYVRELLDRALEPGGLLDKDQNGCDSWEPYWASLRSGHAFLEMEMTGMYIDREVGRMLTENYQQAAAGQLQELREQIGWPEFNPGSAPDCREVLFGEEFARRKKPGAKRPEGAISLRLDPVCTTGKPPKDWVRLRPGENHLYTPSTGKETLGILRTKHKIVDSLRKYRFLHQVLKTNLRPPGMPDEPEEEECSSTVPDDPWDDMENFDGGIFSHIQVDGRVYTHLFPTTETGRARCARPNLTNWSKRREDDYKKILGDRYTYPMRAMMAATPPGPEDADDPWVLVDFDLRGAELFVMAVQAGDEQMIDHCLRNNLSEDDPNYVDVHSRMAVQAFRLNCPPTKSGLKSLGLANLRVAAKTLMFGIPYGRGDEAIIRACKEEGVDVTLEQVAQIRQAIFGTYPGLESYLASCRARVKRPGFIRNPYGRLRRFPFSHDREVVAKMEREAGNFNIQSSVSDIVHRWMYLLYHRHDRLDWKGNLRYRMLLQIHDALLCECRVSSLDWFVKDVIPNTLDQVPLYRCDLDGRHIAGTPAYKLGTEVSIHKRWGVDLTIQEAEELHIPVEYVH
jgi:uracil-DNA glycosylase family 4